MERDTFLKERDTLLERQEQVEGTKRNIQELPAEDLDSEYLEDADHWLAIYGELIGFKRFLLKSIRDQRATSPKDARDALGHDEEIMQIQLTRYELHFAYWTARQRELRSRGDGR